MRIWFSLVLLIASLSLAPSVLQAQREGAATASSESIIPWYSRSSGAPPSLRAELARAQEPGTGGFGETNLGLASGTEGETSKGTYLPVLYSLLVPGTGEIALGYPKRGVALVALEVTAWVGYFYYHDEGLDGRAEFEAFADAHWDYDRWIVDHVALESEPIQNRTFERLETIGPSWQGWPGYHSWADKETEKLNYYETIGKYDWFISGWEDWDPVAKPHDTAVRTAYRSLRQESNSDLDTAEQFVYLSIATRVFSLVETVFLAKKSGRAQSEQEGTDRSERTYSFTTRSTGMTSGEVAFVYRF